MKIKNLTSLRVGAKLTSRRPPEPEMTVVVKGTFALEPGRPIELIEGLPGVAQPSLTGDAFEPGDDDLRGECRYPSDFGDFKLGAEVMLLGSCHAPGGAPMTECPVRVRVGSWSKMLRVVGPRRWEKGVLGSSMTSPEPFTTMPLDWAHALGGATFPDNPAGKGIDSDELPNVELVDPVVRSRGDRPPPASFAPVSPFWPSRWRKVGKQYDETWKKTRAPYVAADFDWTYFHAAPADQQLSGYLRGDEPIELTNLHPRAHVLSGTLPGLRVRVFAEIEGRGLVELPMHLDTLLAKPDEGHLVLLWRGVVAVADRDLTDVRMLVVGSEPLAAEPLPLAHYEAIRDAHDADPLGVAERLPPEMAGFAALMKPGGKLEEAPVDPTDDPVTAALRRGLGRLGASELAEVKKAMGVLLGAPIGEALKGEDPIKKIAEAVANAAKVSPPSGGATPGARPRVALGAALRRVREAADKAKKAAAEHDVELAGIEKVDAFLQDPRLAEADPYAANDTGEPVRDDEIGPGRDLSGRDLSERDLSGRDLRGANLEGAILARANLTRADLTGARLVRAVLSQAILEGAMLRDADLTSAGADDVRAMGADLSGATLEGAILSGSRFDEASLEGARGAQVVARGVDLRGARARGVSFDRGLFDGATLAGADLSEATLTRCLFSDAKAEGVVLRGALLTKTSFSKADLTRASLSRARGDQTVWLGARLDEADLERAVLPRAHFTETRAREAKAFGADLRFARLYRATWERCDLSRANLFGADLGRAELSGTSFARANLYDAKLLDASGAGIDLEGANLKRSTLERS